MSEPQFCVYPTRRDETRPCDFRAEGRSSTGTVTFGCGRMAAGHDENMAPDFIHAYQPPVVEVCGQPERLGVSHFRGDEPQAVFEAALRSRRPEPVLVHRFVPGVRCPECGGTGMVETVGDWRQDGTEICPHCRGLRVAAATSPEPPPQPPAPPR